MAARVLLMGIWTEADDQGIFDWKPVTLKMRLMPVDNVDVAALLAELEGASMLKRFEQDGKQLGAIRNFCKFQRPKTPKYRAIKSVDIRNFVASTYPTSETPDAEQETFPQNGEMPPQMEEEGGRMEERGEEEKHAPAPPAARSRFDEFWKEYPKRDGDNPRKPAEKKFNALVKTGVDPEIMIAGARQAAADARKRSIYATKFVPQAIKWLNDQRFLDVATQAFNEPAAVDWEQVLSVYRRTGHWSRWAGPDPDSPACRAPAQLLEKYGVRTDSLQPEHRVQ
jgi:hypothetical protein